MNFENIELFVFDIAGTTVNETFIVHEKLIEAFGDFGYEIDIEIANKSIAVPKSVGISKILTENFQIESKQLTSNIHQAFLSKIDAYYSTSTDINETDGSSILFDYLKKRGVKIFLDTGFNRKTASIIINRLKWASKIDGFIASDEVKNGRPFPDMIIKAMFLSNCKKASNVIKVGDTKADMIQGKRSGCRYVIGVESGIYSAVELIEAGADLVVQNPNEILHLLKEKWLI